MKLKTCTCCARPLTTKLVTRKGRNILGLYLNCKACGSTIFLRVKNWKELIAKGAA